MHIERWRLFPLLILCVLLAGCASSVRTRLNTFMAPDAEFGRGTIAIQAAGEGSGDSLEFGFYRERLAEHLQNQGYTLAGAEEAEYIARLGYDVERVDSEVRSPNVMFTTGFGSYYRRGGVGFVFGDAPRYEEEYLRRLKLIITRTPDEIGGEPRRVYEATALSEGTCPIMSVVFDEMLAAVFQNFPGENGAVKTVTVRGEARCE